MSTNDLQKLSNCPFCGGEAECFVYSNGEYDVKCRNVFCLAKTSRWDTEAEAIAAWNTRAERTCHDIKPSLPYFKCDSCGMEDMGGTELWIQDGFYRSQKPNYCPNCGAKVVK